MTKAYLSKIPLLCFLSLLAGCDATREFLGLTAEEPDASLIASHAGLETPPDFTLRPPVPGARRPQDKPAAIQAQETLGIAPPPTEKSTGTQAFLKEVRTDAANPNIKRTLEEDKRAEKPEKTLMEILADRKPKKAKAPIINPVEESKRLNP